MKTKDAIKPASRKHGFEAPKRLDFGTPSNDKKVLQTSSKKTSLTLGTEKAFKWGPKIFPKLQKSDSGTPCIQPDFGQLQ